MSAHQILRNLLGNECSICGETDDLWLHHKDGNRENNDIQNIQLLCGLCHVGSHASEYNAPLDLLEVLVKEARLSPSMLANETGLNHQEIKTTLRTLAKLKLVETPARGIYVITDAGRRHLQFLGEGEK